MKKCAECERLRSVYIDATRENLEIASLILAARVDRVETRESLKEASQRADWRWRAAKTELDEHLLAHAKNPEMEWAEAD